ncbi:MAG: flavin reductase family protein [Burkholderiales bacterium]|jgi:flavin reductase (DIM6/NTAB) family NADH-FMN oxidoreductase RutF|nr:flavin reductase family protein [Pseudomonadota bacterium]MDA1012233.1 flavin reductase family protein [Pseudomonadota bacterium]|tara:strand:+ start:34945 stop:35616 length:672 start_codon:yes stop_codon:yes gene_type:complete
MFYETNVNNHGLEHDPFKALVAPRPVGWVSTLSKNNKVNLAPYSYFNAVSDAPPMVMISSNQRKDTLTNIEETGEFVCSLATYRLRDAMNMSSAVVDKNVSEFDLATLASADSQLVAPPRVADSPAALECKLWKVLPIPKGLSDDGASKHNLILGFVVGVYINDEYLSGGLFDSAKAGLIARMGYMDYCHVTPENTFSLNRPKVTENGRSASLTPGPWDGKYR